MSFHTTRTVIRTVQSVSLLVLAHTIFSVLVAAPVPIRALAPSLVEPLETLSALICVTLLWQICLFISSSRQAAQAENDELPEEAETSVVLGSLAEEMVTGWGFCIAWTLRIKDLYQISQVLNTSISPCLALIPISADIAIFTLFALHLQLLFSIVGYASTEGWKSVFKKNFWARRAGWWTGRIELDDEELPLYEEPRQVVVAEKV